MKNKIKITASIFALASLLAAGLAFPVSAATTNATATAKTAAAQEARMAKIHDRANQEIDRRVAALNALVVRISAMKHVTPAQKSLLANMIQSQIAMLGDIKAKIAAESDLATLRSDVQSITKSYRIFMLVVPQGHITAAADRIIDIAGAMSEVGTKLQTRISAEQAAGSDVTALTGALTDFTAKLADAKTQAEAAIAEVSMLLPDNGDQAKLQANMSALKDARTKIKAAGADVKAARADAKTIIQGLKALRGDKTKGGDASSTEASN